MLRNRNIISQEVKENTKKLVKQCHKCELQVKGDNIGRKTIGYNHAITAQDVVTTNITQQEAEVLLNNDLQQKVYKQAENYWGVHLKNMNAWRVAAIFDATYSCGNLRWPKLTQAVFRGNWQDAAEQLMDSRYAHQVGDRAKRNACILRDGKQYALDNQNWDLDEEDD